MSEKNLILKFTIDDLKKFLNYANKIAPVTSMKNAYLSKENKNFIILRHDVDVDIYPAYNLSILENKLDIKSTFFILTTSHTYNPQSSNYRKLLNKMTRNGFEIGLHFDPSIYGDIKMNELIEKLEMECNVLENIINEPIASISLHNPSIHGMYPIFNGYINAYSNELFSDESYLSDSLMSFKGKDPYQFVEKANKKTLQIVLHPEHWLKEGGNYINIFHNYTYNLLNIIDNRFRRNSTYKSLIGNKNLVDYIIKRKMKL